MGAYCALGPVNKRRHTFTPGEGRKLYTRVPKELSGVTGGHPCWGRGLRESPSQAQETPHHLEHTQMALIPGNRKGRGSMLVWLPGS